MFYIPNLSKAGHAVLNVLLELGGEPTPIFEIAREAGVSSNSVRRALVQLRQLKLLPVERYNRARRTLGYAINKDRLPKHSRGSEQTHHLVQDGQAHSHSRSEAASSPGGDDLAIRIYKSLGKPPSRLGDAELTEELLEINKARGITCLFFMNMQERCKQTRVCAACSEWDRRAKMSRLIPKLLRVYRQREKPPVRFVTLDTPSVDLDRDQVRERSEQVMDTLRDLYKTLGLEGLITYLDLSRDREDTSKVMVHAHVLVAGDFLVSRLKAVWTATFGNGGPKQIDIAPSKTWQDAKKQCNYSLKLFTGHAGVFGALKNKETFKFVSWALNGFRRSRAYGIFNGNSRLHRQALRRSKQR